MNVPQKEALILLLDDRPAHAIKKLRELRLQQLKDDSAHLEEATIARSPEEMVQRLRRFLEDPVAAAG